MTKPQPGEKCLACGRRVPQKMKVRRVKPRRVSVNRDPGYRRYLHGQACIVCISDKGIQAARDFAADLFWGARGSDPAHTARNNGLSSKGPDSSCVPLCRIHHREYDAGRAAFEFRYRVDLRELSRIYYQRYLAEKELANGNAN